MDTANPWGKFDARYLAFLETVVRLRPKLHRYCARMTGSVMDGEDVVQDALFHAYRKLETFDESRTLEPWLFHIAHNRCIDFLRSRNARDSAEFEAGEPDVSAPPEVFGTEVNRAVETLVLALPRMERACVLLKDVLDYSLKEVAETVGSTVGSVKAALHRGRAKLQGTRPARRQPKPVDDATRQLLTQYVERFNRRDWAGVRELISADASLCVADRFSGTLSDSPYLGTYERMKAAWYLELQPVDGSLAIVVRYNDSASNGSAAGVTRSAPVRVLVEDNTITHITDYAHCPWMLAAHNLL